MGSYESMSRVISRRTILISYMRVITPLVTTHEPSKKTPNPKPINPLRNPYWVTCYSYPCTSNSRPLDPAPTALGWIDDRAATR